MKELKYRLAKGQHLTRWFLSTTEEEYFDSKPDIMEGKIDNEWLDKGFSIHQYPCRKEFVEKYKDREIPLDPPQNINTLYFPFENPKVEKSGFWFVPTYLATWSKTYLISSKEQTVPFRLKTCGGVKIWVNGEEVVTFTPYTRNIEQTHDFNIPLKKGQNEIIVFFDDLAERDTLYYFALMYKGTENLEISLPLAEDPEKIKEMEELLKEAYFKRDTIKKGPIKIYFPFSINEDIEINIKASGDFMDFIAPGSKTVILNKGEKAINIGDVKDYSMGYNYLQISIEVGDIKINRVLGLQIYQEEYAFDPQKTLAERKEQNLKFIARHGELISQRALAMVAEGINLEKAREILIKELQGIEKRKDCSDFYLVPILWLWIKYRDENIFDTEFWDYAKKVILGFRYWIDEPGNDVMWYFSENHALLFHVSELLAGQIFPEETFSNAEIKGIEHKRRAESRLTEWFDRFFAEGFAEWNSTAYLPIDLIGLFAIYELADSEELRLKAKKAIDKTFYYIALNSHHGITACSHGRTYEKELKGRYVNYTTALNWAAWGIAYLNEATNAQTLFCLSSYEPPAELKRFVDWQEEKGMTFINSMGKDRFVDLYLYKNRDYLLTSAIDFKSGQRGYQEHVIQATFGPEAVFWVNHPGENIPIGFGRPSYWAGNGYLPKVSQYKNIALCQFKISPDHDVHFTHAYLPLYAFDEYTEKNGWWFVKKGNAYGAIYAHKGLKLVTEGINQNRELRSEGLQNLWLIRLGNKKEFGSFENFTKELLNSELTVENNLKIKFTDPVHGSVTADWDMPLKINGKPVEMKDLTPEGRIIYEE